MKRMFAFITINFLFISIGSMAQETGTFTDTRDGKKYKTVKLGMQIWLAEDFSFKTDTGLNVKDNKYRYNWETASKVPPVGWHLPSKEEWEILIKHLGKSKPLVMEKLDNNICKFNAEYRKENGYKNGTIISSEYYIIEYWSSSISKRDKVWNFVNGTWKFTTFRGDEGGGFLGPFVKNSKEIMMPVRLIKN